METISIIIPCYNSEHSIARVVDGVRDVLRGRFDYQIILSNDYSTDAVWQEIQRLCAEDDKIIGLSLSRNFGQQAARMAAIPYVKGEYVVFMDDDGQHPPDGILRMLEKMQEGYDIVYAEFRQKKESWFRIWGSYFNQKTSEWLFGKPKGIYTSSFFVTKKFVVDALKAYKSPFPCLLGFFMSITRNIANVKLEHRERLYGKSGYSLCKLLALWMSVFTGFSVLPLRIADVAGIVFTVIGFLSGIIIGIKKILNPLIPAGYTSIIVVLLICSGMIMLILGLVGEYIGRMFLTMNNLPQYVVYEKINAVEKMNTQEEYEYVR